MFCIPWSILKNKSSSVPKKGGNVVIYTVLQSLSLHCLWSSSLHSYIQVISLVPWTLSYQDFTVIWDLAHVHVCNYRDYWNFLQDIPLLQICNKSFGNVLGIYTCNRTWPYSLISNFGACKCPILWFLCLWSMFTGFVLSYPMGQPVRIQDLQLCTDYCIILKSVWNHPMKIG